MGKKKEKKKRGKKKRGLSSFSGETGTPFLGPVSTCRPKNKWA